MSSMGMTLEEALTAVTINGARALQLHNEIGSLEAGKLADLIVISQDVFGIDPHQIHKTEVLLTWVGGKIVYEAPAMKAAVR